MVSMSLRLDHLGLTYASIFPFLPLFRLVPSFRPLLLSPFLFLSPFLSLPPSLPPQDDTTITEQIEVGSDIPDADTTTHHPDTDWFYEGVPHMPPVPAPRTLQNFFNRSRTSSYTSCPATRPRPRSSTFTAAASRAGGKNERKEKRRGVKRREAK
jgi:hypothetical protein